MSNIIIIYSTTDGHTVEICNCLKQVIERRGNQVTLANILDGLDLEFNSFDKIVLGASIRYGKHGKLITKFIEDYVDLLDSKPNAFFSVNVVARKPEKNLPETNPYLQKFLKKISWKPKRLAVFAGKLDYPSYKIFDRFMIRMIMKMGKGPTDPKSIVEFTNWEDVTKFGNVICEM
ncbi:MAG: menaquinone-dependent protoporphyrinogen IX dehydrogenase [Bacteroidetes bacterium]|nr:menaquinone-dependent protoporphyrinogen IX dehydrogenase [Bacteroidota bacterium]